MQQYLRLLAITTLAFQIIYACLTVPELGLHGEIVLPFTPYLAATVTGILLTTTTGILGLVLSVQRRQRSWTVAFVLLLLLSTYSPLFNASLLGDPTNLTLLVGLSRQLLPSAMLALLALAYAFHTRLRQSGAMLTAPIDQH